MPHCCAIALSQFRFFHVLCLLSEANSNNKARFGIIWCCETVLCNNFSRIVIGCFFCYVDCHWSFFAIPLIALHMMSDCVTFHRLCWRRVDGGLGD